MLEPDFRPLLNTMPSTGRRLLLVEDQPVLAAMFADQIAELGHTVVGPAHSLRDALQLAADALIDGALLDWSLNGQPAGDVADILVRRAIPFVFLTGFDKIPDRTYDRVPILSKPFHFDDLRHTIETTFSAVVRP